MKWEQGRRSKNIIDCRNSQADIKDITDWLYRSLDRLKGTIPTLKCSVMKTQKKQQQTIKNIDENK